MKKNVDFKKEWEKTKAQLSKLSQEAIIIAKQGEKELVKFTEKGKLHVDSTAVTLKMEHLYYLIGKEYVKAKNPANPSAKLTKLVEEIKKLEKQHRSLKGRIKKKVARKTAKKAKKKK